LIQQSNIWTGSNLARAYTAYLFVIMVYQYILHRIFKNYRVHLCARIFYSKSADVWYTCFEPSKVKTIKNKINRNSLVPVTV